MNEIFMNYVLPVLISVLLALLSAAASGLIPYVFALAKNKWAEFAASKPNVANEIIALAPIVVWAVEQDRKNGKIIDLDVAKKTAVLLMESWLKGKGITVDLDPFADLISSAIEAEVKKLPPFISNNVG